MAEKEKMVKAGERVAPGGKGAVAGRDGRAVAVRHLVLGLP